MIPAQSALKPMADAPRDGTVIMCVSREWNNPNAKRQVQPGHWLCDMDGKNWTWRIPYRQGTTIYADGWLTVAEFQAAQKSEGFDGEKKSPPPPPPVPPGGFDL